MKYSDYSGQKTIVKCSEFPDKKNKSSEIFFTLIPKISKDFKTQWINLVKSYNTVLKEKKLDRTSEICLDIYVSDVYNQLNLILNSEFFQKRGGDCPSAITIVQFPPLMQNAKICLKAYHIKSSDGIIKTNIDSKNKSSSIKIKHGQYEQYWLRNLSGYDSSNKNSSSFDQTNHICSQIKNFMDMENLSLTQNTIRTWIYVNDIDNNYSGMVNARKIFFEKHGLSPDKRYPASTGIEGRGGNSPHCLVYTNVLFYKNIKDNQIIKMEAKGKMNSPIQYGVTFERGIELKFGDRKHLYISGTASIDEFGKTLYLGDIIKQTERTLENIKSLLEFSNASFDDLSYLIVYLRDISDSKIVENLIKKLLNKNTPLIFIKGSVCRPEWLIEMEGEAVLSYKNTSFPEF